MFVLKQLGNQSWIIYKLFIFKDRQCKMVLKGTSNSYMEN